MVTSGAQSKAVSDWLITSVEVSAWLSLLWGDWRGVQVAGPLSSAPPPPGSRLAASQPVPQEGASHREIGPHCLPAGFLPAPVACHAASSQLQPWHWWPCPRSARPPRAPGPFLPSSVTADTGSSAPALGREPVLRWLTCILKPALRPEGRGPGIAGRRRVVAHLTIVRASACATRAQPWRRRGALAPPRPSLSASRAPPAQVVA